jgi:glucose/arabinose dehydrogenase
MMDLFRTLPRPAAPRARLRLEPLEERAVPATFDISVIARNLAAPTGIAVDTDGDLVFTQLPTPGVGGSNGGSNSVNELVFTRGTTAIATLFAGEPEPTNIVVGRDGDLYWTCRSAGVIVMQDPSGNREVLVRGLRNPTGIAIDPTGRFLYYTEQPTPGVDGASGGFNSVSRLNLRNGRITVLARGLSEPTDIAVDNRGNVFWTDRTDGTIVQMNRAGRMKVVLSGLDSPEGLAMRGQTLYFTEVPTPGVSGANGGRNTVNSYNLRTGERVVIDRGDPEPTDIAVTRDGDVYWTCTSAGVIVFADLICE